LGTTIQNFTLIRYIIIHWFNHICSASQDPFLAKCPTLALFNAPATQKNWYSVVDNKGCKESQGTEWLQTKTGSRLCMQSFQEDSLHSVLWYGTRVQSHRFGGHFLWRTIMEEVSIALVNANPMFDFTRFHAFMTTTTILRGQDVDT